MRHDLSRGSDDAGLADHIEPFLEARLGDADDPGGVLVGARLHDEMIVEGLQRVQLVRVAQSHGGVVPEQNHFDTLQGHDSIGLGPPPVVADAHAEDAAEGAPYGEPQIADLEESLLQVLPGTVQHIRVAGQVHFAILADELAGLVDQDRGVVPALVAMLEDKLGVTQGEADAEALRFLEQGARLGPGISIS